MPGPGDNRKERKVHRGLAGISAACLGAGHCSVGKHARHKTNHWETRFHLMGPPRTNCSLLEGDSGRHFTGPPTTLPVLGTNAPRLQGAPLPRPQSKRRSREGTLGTPATSKPLTLKACTTGGGIPPPPGSLGPAWLSLPGQGRHALGSLFYWMTPCSS